MAPERAYDHAVEAVADGEAIDWSLLEREASDDEEREQLKWLRVLDNLSALHRGAEDDVDTTPRHSGAGHSGPGQSGPDQSSTGQPRTGEAAAPGAADATLQRWGRFHLLEQVGEGSFGRVYRAWDPQLEREVAIKILHPQFSGDQVTARLLKEGRALAKIRHANVVSVYAVESHESRVGLVMEFVRGQTLDDVVRVEGTFRASDAARAGQDVCRALAAVHRAGFVHRDVKARNVMREEGGRIVLMDFGTGQDIRLPSALRASDRAGTPLYMAPEVLDGAEESAGTDVYSVGVLMFHLLTGDYPVRARTIVDLREAHHRGQRQSLRGAGQSLRGPRQSLRGAERTPRGPNRRVPATLARIVERATAASPDGRYPNTGPLLQALERAYPTDARELAFRRRAGAALAAIAVVLCVLLALGWLTSIAFNTTLERREFANESWRDWLGWGLTASVAPVIVSLFAWLLCVALVSLASLVRPSSDRLRALEASARRFVDLPLLRRARQDATVLASWTLLASSVALIALWWHFAPLIDAVSTGVSFGDPAILARLSPAFIDYQDSYRQAFVALLFVSVIAWIGVRRRAAIQGQTLPLGITVGAVFMIGLTLASLDLPYRLLIHSKFDAVSWNGQACYLLGQRGSDALVLCPGLAPPRNRVVSTTQAALQPLGRRENVYTAFAAP